MSNIWNFAACDPEVQRNVTQELIPRHDQKRVEEIAEKLADFVSANFVGEKAGAVYLASYRVTCVLLQSMIEEKNSN